MAIGIICEYNPFHNGHLYHLNQVKKMYPSEEIILVLGGNFLQRGNLSIIEKYDKAKIALEYGIDLVIELPFFYSTQGADVFSEGALAILNALKCSKIIFGSESNNIESLKEMAKAQLYNKEYNKTVKKLLDTGINYPTAMAKGLEIICGKTVKSPNDILGLSYTKEIIKNNYKIDPITIQRTNSYHSKELEATVCSSTAIRNAIRGKKKIDAFVPKETLKYIRNDDYLSNYFMLLKYKIISEKEKIKNYQTVDEGIENRIIEFIKDVTTLDELIEKIKTKRYTYNKINRMLTHILCSFTKEEAKNHELKYIRVLGFNKKGQNYLNKIKKEIKIPVITSLNKTNYQILEKEIERDYIYNLIMNINDNKKCIIKM